MRRFLILAVVILAARPAFAEPRAPGADYFDFGYFCEVETIEELPAEGTMSGVVNLVAEAPEFLRRSQVVPAQLGVGFGVHVTVKPGYAGRVTITTVHPPMGPEGVTLETWQSDFDVDDISYNGFTFEYPYELVRGDWELSAEINGREIYRIAFQVVDPGRLPPVTCAGGLLS